jgi:hypothetical protein
MSKKYYYTDAIVALYMMKEFGVKFETKHQSKFNGKYFFRGLEKLWVDNIDISDDSIRICSLLYLENNDKTCVNNKFYVAKESQKIFKFKKTDLVKYGFGSVDFYNQISQKNSVSEIIYRDGKQFFMPEVVK